MRTKVLDKSCDCEQKLWAKGFSESCKIKILNKNFMQRSVNKSCKQIWLKVMNKSCEQKYWAKD